MNNRYVQNLEDGIAERSSVMGPKFDEQFEGMGPGLQETRGPEQDFATYLLMVKWYGPDYSRALRLVDPGEYRQVLKAEAHIRALALESSRLTQGVDNGAAI